MLTWRTIAHIYASRAWNLLPEIIYLAIFCAYTKGTNGCMSNPENDKMIALFQVFFASASLFLLIQDIWYIPGRNKSGKKNKMVWRAYRLTFFFFTQDNQRVIWCPLWGIDTALKDKTIQPPRGLFMSSESEYSCLFEEKKKRKVMSCWRRWIFIKY